MIHSVYGPTGYVELSEFNIPVPNGYMLEDISGYGFTVKHGEPAEEWWCIDDNFVEKQNPNIHALPMPLPYGLKTNKATYNFSLDRIRVGGMNKYKIYHSWETNHVHCQLRYDGILCWTFYSKDNLSVKEMHSDGFYKKTVYADWSHKKPIKCITNKAFFNGKDHYGVFTEIKKYDENNRLVYQQDFDGSVFEAVFDDENLIKQIRKKPDGTSEESFFENNTHQYSIIKDENGVQSRIDWE